MLVVNSRITVPLHELQFSYARSSGPGGQNVNKVNSKAILRWNPHESRAIPEDLRGPVLAKLSSRLNQEGELVIASDRYRDQPRNREDCLAKLAELLREAAHRPKRRKETRPTRSSQKKRIQQKAKHGQKKAMRRLPRGGDHD